MAFVVHFLRQFYHKFVTRLVYGLVQRYRISLALIPKRTDFLVSRQMRSILWMLVSLLVICIAAMVMLSQLNLNYSQKAMQKLRQEQIQDIVHTGLYRIGAHQLKIERETKSLASIGENYYQLFLTSGGDLNSVHLLQDQIKAALHQYLKENHGISGGGVWFEPSIMSLKGTSYGIHYNRKKIDGRFTLARLPVNRQYRSQRWFKTMFGNGQNVLRKQNESMAYWSPAYFDFDTDQAIFTVAFPMFTRQHELIGMVTTDWSTERLVELVTNIKVTDNSFAFLNDSNNRNISSLSKINDTQVEQKIVDAILAEDLSVGDKHLASENTNNSLPINTSLKNLQLVVEDEVYELYYASTHAGMVFGAGVPRYEIDQVLLPMRNTNYTILVVMVTILLVVGVYLLFRIVGLIKELQASYKDSLTNLYNRSRLKKDAKMYEKRTLLIVNLDRFKQINNLFGNDCGDYILIEIAKKLLQTVKTQGHEFEFEFEFDLRVYRLSSDEFAILGPLLSEEQASGLAAKVIESIHAFTMYWKHQPINLDASAGIAFQQGDESFDLLLNKASIAVVQARQQMRQFLFYDQLQKMEEGFEKNLYWAQKLKVAIETNQLVPYFQPIYDNQTKSITKYECLVRMLDKEKGVISAGLFIDIASKLRLNRQITFIMIEKSFAAFADEKYEFSINLSYADLVDPEILDFILSHLEDSDIGSRVIFEILESDGIANYEGVLSFIDQVRPFGCKIAIDDFGTGYSNFSHLLKLNVDIIKIDGSLIRYIDDDPMALNVTRSIVQFAHSLDIKTVAEFVHNEAVQKKVVDLGIDFSQGGFFSMPEAKLVR